jgi:YD repeat-containing protein
MVAIVSGNGTGLLNTSASVLGQGGLFGSATTGSSKEGAYVNVANGNLVLQDQDDFIAASGVNLALTRTYNSQGSTSDGLGAQWKLGVRKQVTNLTGTLNAVGSTLTRIDSDGSAFLFKWDSTRSAYVSTDGDGAYQTIVRDGNNWVWRSSRSDLLGLHEIYDALNNGRITTIKDEVGVRLTYQYGADGQLAQIADASGDVSYFDFQNGNLTQIRTDPAGDATNFVRTNYAYDALNRLKSVTVDLTPDNKTDARTYTTTYTYSGDSNRIETLTQSDGTSLTFSYVSTATGWKVASVLDGLGRRTQYDYSVTGKTTVTDPLNNKSEYSYDALGQLVKVTQLTAGGAVATSLYAYDASGNVVSVTGPNGTTTATYDARGNQIQLVDAAGNVTGRTYDQVSNVLLTETYGQASAADPVKNGAFNDSSSWGVTNGVVSGGQLYLYSNTNYSYANQAISTVAGQKYTLTLDVSNPNNCWFAVGASWGGTELAFTSLVNGKNTITFTASGTTTNLTIFDFADYATSPYAITTFDNVAIASSTAGPTKRYVYDAFHRPVYVISPEGRVTQYAYNTNGQLASQTEYSANYYNTSGTVPTAAQMDTWVASADKTNSIQTRYTYDARGQISKSSQYTKFNADGTTAGTSSDTVYTYDMAGNLLSTTDADAHTTNYSYDGLGRVLTTTGPNNATIVNAYDDAANTLRTTMTDGRVHTSVYDKAGQLISTSDTVGTTNLGTSVYGYDAAGNLRMTRSPTGRRTFMLYDDAGRKVGDIDADGTLTEYIYNAANNISRTKQYATRINIAAYSDTAWPAKLADVRPTTSNLDDRSAWNTYDSMGRLADSLDGEGYLTRRTYNALGQMAQVTRFATKLTVNTGTDSFASFTATTSTSDRTTRSVYDNDGKLLGVMDPEGYLTENRYNAAGQLVQTTHYANPTLDANRTSSAIATLRPTVSTSDQMQRFIYDAEGRLVGTVDPKNYLTEIVYTAAGNVKTRTTYNNPVAAGFADSARIDTLRPLSNAGDRVHSYQYNELDQLTREVSPAGVITTYTYDLNGNQVSATVGLATSAESSAQYRYDSFGHVIAELSPIGVAQLKTAGTNTTAIENIWKTYATTYTYDTDGLKTSSTDANGNRTVYYYDADGRLAYTVDAKGGLARSQYNAFGQVSALTRYATAIPADKLAGLAGGTVTTAFTDLVNALPSSSNTSTELFYYDHVGNLTDHADALQYHTVTKYDPFGEAITTSQPGTPGSVTANTAIDANSRVYYDRDGRVTMTVSGAGVVTAYQYDGLGNVLEKAVYATTVTVTDTDTTATILSRAGTSYAQRQRYVYDGRGQAVAVFTAIGSTGATWTVTSQAYDVDGNLTSSTTYAKPLSTTAPTLASVSTMVADNSDQMVRYYYDNDDRLAATATAQRVGANGREWSVTKREYDAAGNVSAVTAYATQLKIADPLAADINTFTAANSNLADEVTRYVYDSANRVIASAVAQGVENGSLAWSVRSMSYDAAGNMIASTEHATKLSSSKFLGDYRLWILSGTASVPDQDRTTWYGYDELNRNNVTVDAANAVTRRIYDAKGNVVQTIAYANLETKAAPTVVKPYVFPADNDADRIARTVYDANDRVAYTVDALGFATEYRYDSADNVIAKVTYAKAVTLARTDMPTADDLRAKVTATPSLDRTERLVYDQAGRLRYSVDAAGYVSENRYDAAGRVLSTILWEVKPTTLPADLRSVTGWAGVLSGKNRTTSYTYDAQGNVTAVTDALSKMESYTYDALGRKLTFTNKLQFLSTWTYLYDAAGRVIQETSPRITTTKNAAYVTSTSTWDAQHPTATTSNVTRLTYDAFGNVVTRTETAVSYDVSIDLTGLERTTTYLYDAAGRQVQTVLPSIKVYDGSADPKLSAGAAASYEKDSGPLSTVVTYNAFGEAITNKDVGGNISSKVYDNRGQVVYERDALNYVTEYQRDSFGNVVKLIRHAVAYDGSLSLSLASLRQLIKSDPQDRTVTTSYDRLNRAVKTVEPQAYIYDAGANAGDVMLAARIVETEYDGFDQVVRRSVYGANASGVAVTAAASNYYFYNVVGEKSAELAITQPASGTTAALGYLTTYDYDAAGNVLSTIEFAKTTSLIVNTDSSYSYVAPTPYQATATSNDRKTSYTYDNLNRKRSETQENALYTDTATGVTQRGSLTTSYDYDALGNQNLVTDALGNTTYTQYDTLGRVTAIKKVPPTGATAAGMPLTVFKLDVFGNVLLRIDYVQGAADNSATNFNAKAVDALDRKTATAYDRNGNAIQTVRGVGYENYMTFTSYDMFGRAAKQWSTVTTANGVQTAYTVTNYDVLGRVSSIITPANAKLDDPTNTTSAQSVTRINRYNMFGELTQRDLQEAGVTRTIETDAYDNAGHLWRSNADDGVTKVMAYDAQGNVTSVLRSTSTAAVNPLSQLTSIAGVFSQNNLLRTDTRYDLLGHVIGTTNVTDMTALRRDPRTDTWAEVHTAFSLDDLLIVSRPDEAAKTVTLSYRLAGSTAWINASADRLQTINGYRVFATAGLASGAYEYRVQTQGAGEAAFISASGTVQVAATTDDVKDMKVLRLFAVLFKRAPTVAELDNAMTRLNTGATLAQVAQSLLESPEVKAYLSATPATAMQQIFADALGRTGSGDANYASDLSTWTARYQKVTTVAGDNRGQAIVDLIDTTMTSLDTSAVTLKARTRINNRATVAALYTITWRGANATSAASVMAAADQATSGAITLDAAKSTAINTGKLEFQRNQIAQLYVALLGRAPDPAGMVYWFDERVAVGAATVEDVAKDILESKEGTSDPALYPTTNLTPAQYLNQLVTHAYQTMLGRVPSAAELTGWLNKLNGTSGETKITNAQFALQLADSVASYSGTDTAKLVEKQLFNNRTAVALVVAGLKDAAGKPLPVTGKAINILIQAVNADSNSVASAYAALQSISAASTANAAITTATAALAATTPLETARFKLARMYAALLNRAPDADGLAFYLSPLPTTREAWVSIAYSLLWSNESRTDTSLTITKSVNGLQQPTTDAEFVQRVYDLAFNGPFEQSVGVKAEMATFVKMLADGKSRAEVAVSMIDGMLGFTGRSPYELTLKDLLDNKAAVGVAMAVDMKIIDGNTQRFAMWQVTAWDINTAINYAYQQNQVTIATRLAANSFATASSATAVDASASAIGQKVSGDTSLATANVAMAAVANANRYLDLIRLYVGFLGRTPDEAGVKFYFNNLSKLTGEALGQAMYENAEASATNGLYPPTLTNAEFVQRVYDKTFGTTGIAPPDSATWVQQLQSGTNRGVVAYRIIQSVVAYTNGQPDATAQKILNGKQGFSQRVKDALAVLKLNADSAEAPVLAAAQSLHAQLDALTAMLNSANANKTQALSYASSMMASAQYSGDGLSDYRLKLTALYKTLLQRTSAPTQAELSFWTNGGAPLDQVAQSMITSGEGAPMYGSLDNTGFVQLIYQRILNRAPDSSGLSFWVSRLAAGVSRGAVAMGVLQDFLNYSDYLSSQLAYKKSIDSSLDSMLQTEMWDASYAKGNAYTTWLQAQSTLTTKKSAYDQAAPARDQALTAYNSAKSAAVDAHTIAANPSAQRAVTYIYVCLRGYTDLGGVAFWIWSGDTDKLISDLMPGGDNRGFVLGLYSMVLGRTPREDEVSYWVNVLDAGNSRVEVAKSFMYSSEGHTFNDSLSNRAISTDTSTVNSLLNAETQAKQKYDTANSTYTTAYSEWQNAVTAEKNASAAYTKASLAYDSFSALANAHTYVTVADDRYQQASKAQEDVTALTPTVTAKDAELAPLKAYADANDTTYDVANASYTVAAASVALISSFNAENGLALTAQQVKTVAQIYAAIIGKQPTVSALKYWTDKLAAGTDVVQVINGIMSGPEAAQAKLFPAGMSNDAFVTQMYATALNRGFAADPGGLQFWSSQLSGPNAISRAQLVRDWIKSTGINANSDTVTFDRKVANILYTATIAANTVKADTSKPSVDVNIVDYGSAYAAALANAAPGAAAAALPAADYVLRATRLYVAILDRTPDANGLIFWANGMMNAGVSDVDMADKMLTSPEAQSYFDPNQDKILFAYQISNRLLGRYPTYQEQTNFYNMSKAEIIVAIVNASKNPVENLTQQESLNLFNGKVMSAVAGVQAVLAEYTSALTNATNLLNSALAAGVVDRHSEQVLYGVNVQTQAATITTGQVSYAVDRWGNVLAMTDARNANLSSRATPTTATTRRSRRPSPPPAAACSSR